MHAPSSYPSQSSYRVAVLFLGGHDDREALAIGARMARQHSINLTTVWLLQNGSIAGDNATERKIDNEATAGNYRVMYTEEVAMDGTVTTSVIVSMENCYELVTVGRHHDRDHHFYLGLVSGMIIKNWE